MTGTGFIEPPNFAERLIRLLYPEKCVFCGEILPGDAFVSACGSCLERLPRYGKGFFRNPRILCLDGLFASFVYEGVVEDAIHSMKYRGKPRVARTLAALMWEEMAKQRMLPDFDLVVPVPMHWRKRISRGYNQSEKLGQALGKIMNVPVKNALAKTKNTKPQSLSTREERLRNLENTIIVPDPSVVRGLGVLLVDDVVTTGATLGVCARALKEAGAEWVFAAVIAIA